MAGAWVASFVTLAEWERLALCGVHAVQLELAHARLAGLRFTNMATGRSVAPLPAEIAEPWGGAGQRHPGADLGLAEPWWAR